MSDWRLVSLGDLIESLDAGVSVNAEDRPHGAGEIGVLKTSAISGGVFHAEQNKAVLQGERRLVAEPVQADSILVSRMNTPALVGESCYVTEAHPTLFLPDRLWQLKPKDRLLVNMRWLSFVLQSAHYRSYVEVHATGTSGSMKNLPKSKLLDLPVLYPPLSEQKFIARTLDTLDTIIRQTESILYKLKALKHGLFHDLLTRGIGTDGELRQPPSEAPQLYKESPLGLIPKEWNISYVKEEFEIQLGKMLDAKKNSGLMKPYLGNKAVQWDNIDLNEVQLVPLSLSDMDRFKLRSGDLLVCEGGEVGRAAIWEDQTEECYYQKALHRLRPTKGYRSRLMLELLRYWMDRDTLFEYISKTSIAHLTQEKLAVVPLPVPPSSEQDLLVIEILAQRERQEREERELEKLRHLKSGLMDDLLSGRVRVTLPLEEVTL